MTLTFDDVIDQYFNYHIRINLFETCADEGYIQDNLPQSTKDIFEKKEGRDFTNEIIIFSTNDSGKLKSNLRYTSISNNLTEQQKNEILDITYYKITGPYFDWRYFIETNILAESIEQKFKIPIATYIAQDDTLQDYDSFKEPINCNYEDIYLIIKLKST